MYDTILKKLSDGRECTFGVVIDELKSHDNPKMLETGCVRSEDDFTAGYSTVLFGHFLKQHGGTLLSIDNNKDNCEIARSLTKGLPVTVICKDSLQYLRDCKEVFDVIYLDSMDTYFSGHAEHCLKEAQLAVPLLREGGMLLIDDSSQEDCIAGKAKGRLAIPWLRANHFKLINHEYQALFIKDYITFIVSSKEEIEKMLSRTVTDREVEIWNGIKVSPEGSKIMKKAWLDQAALRRGILAPSPIHFPTKRNNIQRSNIQPRKTGGCGCKGKTPEHS